ncbi:MAG: nucleotidyltransferase family protein, partial [Thermoleophilia bacterium]
MPSHAGCSRLLTPGTETPTTVDLRVLEACARARGAAGAAAFVDSLRDADWGSLLPAAASHGMHGLLFRRLMDCCPAAAPAEARERLQDLQQAAGRRGLRQEARLLDVLDRLAEQGIQAVPFKGPLLAERVYSDVSMRVCSDLDVLVKAREVAAARDILLAAGWRVAGLTRPSGPSLLQAAECELVLEHPASGLYLELHWRTGPRFARASFPAEPLIARAGEMDVLGRHVPCLGDEDHFLVLIVHGATHCWDRLELVCTAAEFIAQERIADWPLLLRRARALGCRRRLLVAGALARDVAGVTLPAALAAAVRQDA